MPDGKPNFSGVWAGPAFTHSVGPNDTDTPRVTSFDRSRMAPFLPGAEAKFLQRPTGDLRHDDPITIATAEGTACHVKLGSVAVKNDFASAGKVVCE